MNIFIDNGEGHIMTKRMIPILKKQNHKLYLNPQGCDVQLSFVRFGINTKLPKVVRIDGIYYNTMINWKAQNQSISNSHQIADGIIYQSYYSRMFCEALLSKRKKNAKAAVIYNGIEPYWCGKPNDHEGFNIIIIGKHRRHKRLKEIIELFLKFHKINTDSHLHIFGLLYDNKIPKHPAIFYHGNVERTEMFSYLRSSDLTLHLSKRDSCPNSVLECISAGIPVITTNNCGGATEMCKMTPGCIIIDGDGDYNDVSPVPHYNEEWNALPPNVEKNIIESMVSVYETRHKIELPEMLNIQYVTKKYLEMLNSVKN